MRKNCLSALMVLYAFSILFGTSLFSQKYNLQLNKTVSAVSYKRLLDEYCPQRKVIIALIDSGFSCKEDISKGRIWNNTGEKSSNNIDDDGNGYIDDKTGWNFVDNSNDITSKQEHTHGTSLLNILVGKQKNQGIIKDIECCEIMLIKALGDENENGKMQALVQAIEYAEKNGAVICNLSLSTYQKDNELKKVIENSNMLFVVAAGNDGENLNEDFPSYPSAFALNNILSVTAIDDEGVLLPESNYGDKYVDVAMYGSNIDVRFADGGHEMVSGTSIAVPYVSASAALIYAYALNELSSTEIKDIIVQSSEKTKELSSKVKAGGYLNFQRAFNVVLKKEKQEIHLRELL